ncbi:hypothetical protein SARC_03582 [Sphaeroforma arctica JP610]|uniref:WW domain-containing protein n=1 Tax=Sphaeroforma arctica JP610 TaxID=667725 RepID=A0A0L0G576_9EUKA|nr:hypothetical protein SARC_03582 [Sphaeroforma arctica JP610]KNC84192.1 hypothetical protein SARC_03582 [Sphaeroforma arctica JP610]|eukprot:XP_014158094.1 hypothetical protein SARC_03582 [Sphaeroforma arctica JP610]
MADGPASNILDIGDVILTVNGVIVYMVSHEDAVSVLKQAGNSLTLEVVRDPALRDLIKGSVKPQPEKIKNDFVPTVTEYPWSNDEMPEGWYKGVCPNTDRNYFINPHTKTTTWLDPREEIYLKRHQTLKKQAKGVLPFGWEEVRTDEGEVYYANHIKKVTQWDHPNPKKEPSRKNSWAMLWSPRSSKTSTDETSVKSKSRGSLLSNARGSILSNARGSIFSNARGSVPSNTSLPSRTNSVAV